LTDSGGLSCKAATGGSGILEAAGEDAVDTEQNAPQDQESAKADIKEGTQSGQSNGPDAEHQG
jgi:hypothetical protein